MYEAGDWKEKGLRRDGERNLWVNEARRTRQVKSG